MMASPKVQKSASTPVQADAMVDTKSVSDGGFQTFTTSSIGKLKKKAQTGKTFTTGGSTSA